MTITDNPNLAVHRASTISELRHEAMKMRAFAIDGLISDCYAQAIDGIHQAHLLDAAADFLEGERTWFECYLEARGHA